MSCLRSQLNLDERFHCAIYRAVAIGPDHEPVPVTIAVYDAVDEWVESIWDTRISHLYVL